MDQTCNYGFGRTLDIPYDEAVALTRAALKKQGFGIMSEIDVRARMAENLGVDFPPYIILGACNPPLAHRVLSVEPNIGLLLPCNVIVYSQNDGQTRVMAMDPVVALELVANPRVDEISCQVKSLLEKALLSI
jgi:uncharacterized protein (DUF302 family)